MVFRILAGVGLFALGYYVGREIGKTEHIRRQLQQAREASAEGKADVTAAGQAQG
jgi:hypothetical protein